MKKCYRTGTLSGIKFKHFYKYSTEDMYNLSFWKCRLK